MATPIFVTGCDGGGRSYGGPTWEYKRESLVVGREGIRKMLNEFGQEGWELVAVDNGEAYFKRKFDPGIQRA